MANPWEQLLSTPVPEREPTEESLVKNMLTKRGAAPSNTGDKQLLDLLMQAQQKDVNKLRSDIDNIEAMPAETDYSPLLGLIDTWTGSNLSKSYTKPKTQDEKLKELAVMRKVAADQQGDIVKNQLGLTTAGGKMDLGALALLLKGSGQQSPWREDATMQRAADAVHKAPNIKLYTDMANSVGESAYLVNRPDATVTEAHEALQNLTRAIGRATVSSDYRQKQLDTPTVSEWMSKLQAFITSDPNQAAPPEVLKLIRKISNRVLDTYDASIKREANRAAQGKLGKYRTQSANEALQEAKDFYTSGKYMQELRDTYALDPSEFKQLDKDLKPVDPGQLVKPAHVEQADWDALGPAGKAKLMQTKPVVK